MEVHILDLPEWLLTGFDIDVTKDYLKLDVQRESRNSSLFTIELFARENHSYIAQFDALTLYHKYGFDEVDDFLCDLQYSYSLQYKICNDYWDDFYYHNSNCWRGNNKWKENLKKYNDGIKIPDDNIKDFKSQIQGKINNRLMGF